MSLKQEIQTWVEALDHYDNQEFEQSLKKFDDISDTSKILFNLGVIHATLGEHDRAIDYYQRAVRLDQYLAVAYFQQGVSNFLLGDFEEALANFNDALLYLRGNQYIDYDQLGLKFKLYSCEVLFNRGLCYIYLQQREAGLKDFSFAVKEKLVEDHNVIDEAIREEAEGYTVFSIPVGVVYRPNSAKVKNLKTKDYLGRARLVAASEKNNAFTGFAGSEVKRSKEAEDMPPRDDRLPEGISFAATNLVKPDLRSRARQQSEPPIKRQQFPPTPPPETEKPLSMLMNTSNPSVPPSMNGRAASVRNRMENRPEKLDIQKAQAPPEQRERPRIGTMRTASEPRGPSRNYSQARNPDFSNSRSRLDQGAPQGSPLRRIDSGNENLAHDDHYREQLFDMYRRSSDPRQANPRMSQRHQYIEEEDEFESEDRDERDERDDRDTSSVDENEFEMIPQRRTSQRPLPRTNSRRPEISKVRVKAHLGEDTRYIMIGTKIEFADFQDRIRMKFDIRGRFKSRVRDEEDLITMGDQDDLDLAMSTCKSEARRERSDMGKMEVWVQEMA